LELNGIESVIAATLSVRGVFQQIRLTAISLAMETQPSFAVAIGDLICTLLILALHLQQRLQLLFLLRQIMHPKAALQTTLEMGALLEKPYSMTTT
jgi:hypothetical protein